MDVHAVSPGSWLFDNSSFPGPGPNEQPVERSQLALSHDYDEAIFRNFTRLGIPAADILHRGMPRDGRAGPAYFRHLIETGSVSQLALAWDWLRENSLDNRVLLGFYVDWLLRARHYETAFKVLAGHAQRGAA